MDTKDLTAYENVLVNTVEDKKSKCTHSDYLRAVFARKIQRRVGHSTLKTFIDIMDKKKLRNCPLDPNDVAVAEDIFGPSVAGLKEKTARQPSDKCE